MNRLIITGNLTRDPESRVVQTSNGDKTVVALTVAVNGNRKDDVTFVRVNAWDKLGENCARFLAKGRYVTAIGEVKARPYADRNGNPAAALEMRADNIEFGPSKAESYGDAYEPREAIQKTRAADVLHQAQQQLAQDNGPNDLPF